jgi:hypothetical protein
VAINQVVYAEIAVGFTTQHDMFLFVVSFSAAAQAQSGIVRLSLPPSLLLPSLLQFVVKGFVAPSAAITV